MTTLHQKAKSATKWSAVDVFMRQGIQFGISMVLARLLTPEDFGVIAMLALFVGVAGVFIDGGFSSALIQRQDTTPTDESTVFYFNLGMGTVATLVLCMAAPWIAAFFKQPALQGLTYMMAASLIVNAFGSIHSTLLTKEMNFKTTAKVGMVGALSGGVTAIYMASQEYGVWSLAGSTLASSIITVLLLWLWHPWRPVWTFKFSSLQSFFGFGGYQMALSLLDTFATNFYSILIGKLYSVRDVGFYNRANSTQKLPITVVMGIVNRVAFSTFSQVSEDKARLARGLRQAQAMVMFVNIPLLVGVIILAEPLVLSLFGGQWMVCVPILQVLGLGGLILPLQSLNLNVLKAQGRADLNFKIAIYKKIFAISLMITCSFYGIMAIAWAQVAIAVFAYFMNTHYTKILLGYSGFQQLADLRVNFMAVIPMGIVIYLMNGVTLFPPLIKLLVISVVGCAIYLLTCRLVCRDLLVQCLSMVGIKIKSR